MENLILEPGRAIVLEPRRDGTVRRYAWTPDRLPMLKAILAHLEPQPPQKTRRSKAEVAAEKAEALANGEAVAAAMAAKNANRVRNDPEPRMMLPEVEL